LPEFTVIPAKAGIRTRIRIADDSDRKIAGSLASRRKRTRSYRKGRPALESRSALG
jgi:hypothetical protein